MHTVVLFDIWGTVLRRTKNSFLDKLHDTYAINRESLRENLKTRRDLSSSEALVGWLYNEYGIVTELNQIKKMENQCINESRQHSSVNRIMTWLFNQEFTICSYSNCTYLTKKVLESHQINFTRDFLSFETGCLKPNINYLRSISEGFLIDKSHVIVIGDSYEKDLRPAICLGLRSINVVKESRQIKNYYELMNEIENEV